MVETLGDNAKTQLRGFVSELERLTDEKDLISQDIKQIYVAVKEAGLSTKALRRVIRRRSEDKAKRAELDDLIASYELALGDLKGTPLGQAAIERATAHA